MFKFQIRTIATDCVSGFRSVHVHTGKKVEGHSGMWNAEVGVWVPESFTNIEDIKSEAYRLAKDYFKEIGTSESEMYVRED